MEGEQYRSAAGGAQQRAGGSDRFGRDAFGPDGGDPQDLPPAEALKAAGRYFGELKSYAGDYVAAKLDGIKLSAKRAVILAGLGLVGLIVGGSILVTAAVLLLTGLANLLASAFNPPKPWFGQLIVGFIVLAGAFTGTWLMLRKLTGASKKATLQKYQAMHEQQRRDYGHDVAERSRQATSS
jgi:hypothetical protein